MYNRLSPEEAIDYERLKVALLERYNFTERGYREKFREARPEGHGSPRQFVFWLKNYFTEWVELAEVEQTFMGVVDLIVREQVTNSYPKNISIWLKQSNPNALDQRFPNYGSRPTGGSWALFQCVAKVIQNLQYCMLCLK